MTMVLGTFGSDHTPTHTPHFPLAIHLGVELLFWPVGLNRYFPHSCLCCFKYLEGYRGLSSFLRIPILKPCQCAVSENRPSQKLKGQWKPWSPSKLSVWDAGLSRRVPWQHLRFLFFAALDSAEGDVNLTPCHSWPIKSLQGERLCVVLKK